MSSIAVQKLSVVAPMFNEEDVITSFLDELLYVLDSSFPEYEIILVDDGSTDKTILKCLPYLQANQRIRVIVFSRNYGHEIASTAGLDAVTGNYVVLMDSDLQHPPSLIPQMLAVAVNEGYDVVCGARTNREHESWFKKITARWFYRISKNMTGFDLSSDTGNFRLMSRKVVDSLKQMKENNRHLLMMFAYIGFNTTKLSYECPPRFAGNSKYTLKKLLTLSVDSVVSFSARPLHVMAALSLFVSLIMMLYAGFILLEKLFLKQTLADGMASLIFLISGLFSLLFLFLAIISEYISRILVESKNRPLYYIKYELNQNNIQYYPETLV